MESEYPSVRHRQNLLITPTLVSDPKNSCTINSQFFVSVSGITYTPDEANRPNEKIEYIASRSDACWYIESVNTGMNIRIATDTSTAHLPGYIEPRLQSTETGSHEDVIRNRGDR